MLAHPNNIPRAERTLDAMVVWMSEVALVPGSVYLLKHTTRTVKASCTDVVFRVNPVTLHLEDMTQLQLNEIGRLRFTLFEPLFVDEYRRNRATGGFIVVDADTNATVGAGMVIARKAAAPASSRESRPVGNVFRQPGRVAGAERAQLLGQAPLTVWLTGLPGSGKSTLAHALERRLIDAGRAAFVLDGDNLRHGLTRGLGFTPEGRRENVRRVAEAARLMNDAGLIVIAALISPYREDRLMAGGIVGPERFFEVYVSASAAACEMRDPKGLYARARRGEITEFTGVNAPYESPEAPALQLESGTASIDACVDQLFAAVALKVFPPTR